MIPLIKAHETIAIEMPTKVNYAFSIYALSEAKRINAVPFSVEGNSLREIMLAQKRDVVPMEPIGISIDYTVTNQKFRTQRFVVIGWLLGRVATMSTKIDKKRKVFLEPDGLTAWIDNIEVEPE